jgi:endonuclease/exonuclease/phosphatase family metal-dependent hydrolase
LGRATGKPDRPGVPNIHIPNTTNPAAGLRVLTYNVHACLGLDGRCAPTRIARVLARQRADIILLQELDRGRARSRQEDQLEEIARQLGYEAVWCPTVEYDRDGAYGHGLLTRLPVEDVRFQKLPGGARREPRAALHARVRWSDQHLQVVSTHLSLERTDRLRQARALLEEEGLDTTERKLPWLVAGDFNTTAGSPAYRLLAKHLHEVQAHCPGHVGRPTFPSMLPLRQLDHIFISRELAVRQVHVPQDALLRRASDHLPLIADLNLANGTN